MEVLGFIKVIEPMQNVSASFQKRDFVVTTEEQYPQHILLQFTQDKCDLLNNYKVGDKVSVSINLRGREWVNPQGETKYFNTIQAWKIANIQPAHYTTPQPAAQQQQMPANLAPSNAPEEDDLMF